MTIDELLQQAKELSPHQREELAYRLLDLNMAQSHKTGAEIAAKLRAMDEPIRFVDPHIEDPVEWVKAQRQKRHDNLFRKPEDE